MQYNKNTHPFDVLNRLNSITKQQHEFIANYAWDHYCYFARQRAGIFDELKLSLAEKCIEYEFHHWQRVVDYKYTLTPLSAKGSIVDPAGGRFNIGDIDQTRLPRFPALYLAEDRETAYKEKFSLPDKLTKEYNGITAEQLVLTSNKSITIVCLKGKIKQVLDLRKSETLKKFFKLIKPITLPKKFLKRARHLNVFPMHEVKTLEELLKTIFAPDWRVQPMIYDVPSNSQILGQIAHAAGIEGILYPSKISSKKSCLAVFPDNFENSPSYISIEDATPEICISKLDYATFPDLT